jgi:uncharacterized protein YdhG (YjbR/CyaY superfamily)
MQQAKSVDQYIQNFPPKTRTILKKFRQLIQKAAPKAVESISYGLVGYKLNGRPLVYFGGWKNHIGFYATPNGNAAFKQELSKYKGAKGSVQFPLTEPMPYGLITKIVKFRMKQSPTSSNNSKS